MFLLSSWFLFCFLINAGYKSRLSSLLVHPPLQRRPNLRDVIEDGYDVIVDKTHQVLGPGLQDRLNKSGYVALDGGTIDV